MSKVPHPKSAPKTKSAPKRGPKPATATVESRAVAVGIGAFVLGAAGLIAAAVIGEAYLSGRKNPADDAAIPTDTPPAPAAANNGPAASDTPEHVPTDLDASGDPGAGGRAPDAFRPDPTAPVSPEMRESLRPATGPGPSLSGGESVVSTLERD